MPAGRRDQRIQLQNPSEEEGEIGGQSISWADYGPEIFAEIKPQNSVQALAVQREEARGLYRVTIPNVRALVADWRIVWVSNGDKLLVIRDASDPGQRAVERTLICEEAGAEMTA